MTKFFISSFLLALCALTSFNLAHATPYEEAVLLFNNRAQSRETIQSAKDLFLAIITNKNEEQSRRLTSLDYYARLSLYEGEIAKKAWNVKNATAIFEDCISVTEHLSPKEITTLTPQYTYWRSVCIGLWGANASIPTVYRKRKRIREMNELIAVGLKQFPEYDGYGFDRIQAGMYIRSKYLSLLNLYHPDKALAHVEKSLSHGSNVYIDYLIKADALIALGRKAEAKGALSGGIIELEAKLQAGTLSHLVNEENRFFLYQMKKMLQKMG